MNRRTLWPIALCLAAAWASPGPAVALEDEELPLSACPPAVQKTIREEAKGSPIDGVSRETEDGRTTYWADVTIGGKSYSLGVAADGTLTELALQVDEEDVRVNECPDAVQKTFDRESGGAKIEAVGRETKFGQTLYVALATVGGKDYRIKVAEDGTLWEKMLVIETDEVDVSDCPAAVQKAFQEHSRGEGVKEVTRSSGLGKRVFAAVARFQGKAYDIELDDQGGLISKSLHEDE